MELTATQIKKREEKKEIVALNPVIIIPSFFLYRFLLFTSHTVEREPNVISFIIINDVYNT